MDARSELFTQNRVDALSTDPARAVKYDPQRHQRRSIHLHGYDYAQAGAYFVTICVQNRDCLFGEVVDGIVQLSDAGRIVDRIWHELPQRFQQVTTDAFVVMPNHIHGIILVGAQFIAPHASMADGDHGHQGAMNRAPTPDDHGHQGTMNRAPTLGEMVRVLKAVSTRQIRQQDVEGFAWQRNYYEHIIRNDDSLDRIRKYIVDNPQRWALDRENPTNKGGTPVSRSQPREET